MSESLGICGLAFPLAFDSGGKLRTSSDAEHIKHSVSQILLTCRGSIPFSQFGSLVPTRVFSPVNSAAMIRADAEEALNRWEKRITLTGIDSVPSNDPSVVAYAVAYQIKTTQQQQAVTLTQGR